MKVVVIGAGAAGLAATYALRKAGVVVATFESRTEAVGRAYCYEKDGFIFDTGAQFMAKMCTTQLRLCREMGMGDQVFSFGLKTSHWSDGKIVDMTIEELRRFVPIRSEDILMTEVARWDEAICLEAPGEFPAMYCLKRNHLRDVKGLHLAGEYMYLISCVEGALRSGEDAAAAILASQQLTGFEKQE